MLSMMKELFGDLRVVRSEKTRDRRWLVETIDSYFGEELWLVAVSKSGRVSIIKQ